MNELAEILSKVDGDTREKITKLCANYENEINHLKREYKRLQENNARECTVSIRQIYNVFRSVKSALRRRGVAYLFLDEDDASLKAITCESRLKSAYANYELLGIYRGESVDVNEVIQTICENVNIEYGKRKDDTI